MRGRHGGGTDRARQLLRPQGAAIGLAFRPVRWSGTPFSPDLKMPFAPGVHGCQQARKTPNRLMSAFKVQDQIGDAVQHQITSRGPERL